MNGQQRVAVVTGAGRGLGRATALRFAADGIDVAVLARSDDQVQAVADEVRALGRRAMGLSVDVSSTPAVEQARDAVFGEFGRVDILVNNAATLLFKPLVPLPGVGGSNPDFARPTSDEEWDAVLDVQLGGAVRTLRAFGPTMIEQRYGRVVNVVSNVVRRTVPFTTAYDTAKAGLVQLTRSLAREWARYGVTVNAAAPGHFRTAMTDAQFADPVGLERLLARVPMKRAGEPEEFAALLAYLCSEQAGYVTGELIAVDGGETV